MASLFCAVSAAPTIQPLRYSSFPLGSINCSGWLRQQLVLTANGQAGHLEFFWEDVMDSVWIGGHHDNSGAGHERGPYWYFPSNVSMHVAKLLLPLSVWRISHSEPSNAPTILQKHAPQQQGRLRRRASII